MRANARVKIEVSMGEITVRTRKRYWLVAFAVQIHLLKAGNRWAFIQFGNRTLWLKRS